MHLSLPDIMDKGLLGIHIAAGILALIAGIAPMITHKGGTNHRKWGKIYFWSMVVIFVTAQLLQIFFRTNRLVFFAANLAFYQAYTGYRTIKIKSPKNGSRPTLVDWLLAGGAMLSGLAFIVWASSPFWSPALAQRIVGPRIVSLSVLGTWLGIYTCFWPIADMIRFLRPHTQNKQWWWFHHLNAMLNSYGSALVAFSAVNGQRIVPIEYVWLLWVIPGFGFGLVAFIWGQYYRRKFSRKPVTVTMPALPARAIIVGALLVSGLSLRAPAALPANAPAMDFSAERVLQYIPTISQSIHPIGTPEQAVVRDYLVKQLRMLGLETELQETTSVVGNVLGGGNVAGSAINIVGRLHGTHSTFPVVLVAHYDAPPGGYGANKNGVSSGVLLETVRALKAGPPLKNDVIVLISDGEEIGAIGAEAFITQHRWAAGGGVALNFDSRGSTGPSMMYETNSDNGAMIPVFAHVPQPFGNSLTNEVYRRLPFQTDFTMFKRAGWSGFNFAYLDGYPYYQSRLDTIEHVDVRSVQHHGSYALSLTRSLGMLDQRPSSQSAMVYFDVLQRMLIYYPISWVVPLAAIVSLLFVVVVVLGVRRKHVTYRGIAMSALAFLAALIIPALAVTLAWQLVLLIDPAYRGVLLDVYNNPTYRIAFISLTVALVVLLYSWFSHRIPLPALAVGPLVTWLLLTLATAGMAPGASYLFMVPLLFILIALGLLFRAPAPLNSLTSRQAVLVALASVPGIILLFPITLQLSITLGTNAVGVTSLCITLLMGLLIIPLCLLSRVYWRLIWGGGLAIAVVGLVYGSLTAGFDAQHPQPTNLFYALDAETHQAHWASDSDVLDAWTTRVLGGAHRTSLPSIFPPYANWQPLEHPAPPLALVGPEVTPLLQSDSKGVRTLRLRLTSVRQAPIMQITLGNNLDIMRATVNDKPIPVQSGYKRKSWWELTYFRVPPEGIVLEVQFKGTEPLEVTAVDRSYGVPEQTGIVPRPPESVAAQFPFSIGDVTLVRQAFEFR